MKWVLLFIGILLILLLLCIIAHNTSNICPDSERHPQKLDNFKPSLINALEVIPHLNLILNVDKCENAHAMSLCSQNDITCLHIPFSQPYLPVDHVCRQLDQVYHVLDRALSQNQSVLLHCFSGENRSVVVAAYYLVRKYHWRLDDPCLLLSRPWFTQ